MRLTAIYEPVEDGWTQARLAELPAVITAAPSRDEARELLVDALREYLLSLGPDDGSSELGASASTDSLDVVLDA
jgi:predicted RNase H-like HicB family nuclease